MLFVPEPDTVARLLAFARERGSLPARTEGSVSPYIADVMELCYLCRLRPVEAITLTDAHATSGGVRTNRRKGSRDVIVRWTPRLRAAWDHAASLRAGRCRSDPRRVC